MIKWSVDVPHDRRDDKRWSAREWFGWSWRTPGRRSSIPARPASAPTRLTYSAPPRSASARSGSQWKPYWRRMSAGSQPIVIWLTSSTSGLAVQRRRRVHDDVDRQRARRRRDAQLAAGVHAGHVGAEGVDVARHLALAQAEVAADDAVVAPQRVELVVRERADVLAVDEHRRLGQRGQDPQQELGVVGAVGRPGRERARGLGAARRRPSGAWRAPAR